LTLTAKHDSILAGSAEESKGARTTMVMQTTSLQEQPAIPPEASGREVQKICRLRPEEDQLVMSVFIPMAHKMGCIKEPSLQNYMIFALNCAAGRLRDVYKQRIG